MKNRYIIEARGPIALRYAQAEFGIASPAYSNVQRERRARPVGSPFRTREAALRDGLSRVLELGSRTADVDSFFGAVYMIDMKTGHEELVR